MDRRRPERHKSGFDAHAKAPEMLGFSPASLGHSYPQQKPHPDDAAVALKDPLGAPLSIRDVAGLIGCSSWTVRQKYLPIGLPHHRLTPNGKLIFYESQVIRWLLARQQKGGNTQ
jgi:hypothetical protein